ncbi:hypothetical protein JIN78_01255 [Roseibacillus ishigakijimensis]|uniref:Uncharacterized protein n=1 Tax=Roseibacillus ishigakijimensis TaxID=454146 RepID=A0A934RKT2_9BACT|nr:hypothetical protein [Roseibacillus ishigakijimensis]
MSNLLLFNSSYRGACRSEYAGSGTDLTRVPAWGIWREGYIEGIAADMWLGEAFWQHAKCSKEEVLAADWLQVEERPNHLYVKAWPHPFDKNEGEQRERQLRLLDFFFGIK